MNELIRRINELIRSKNTRGQLRRLVSLTACLVVFVTTYALVLPAITMERTAQCGLEVHEHTAECYERVPVCGKEESGGHRHSDACYQNVLVCGKTVHTHSASCYRDVVRGKYLLAAAEGDMNTAMENSPAVSVPDSYSGEESVSEEAADSAEYTAGAEAGTEAGPDAALAAETGLQQGDQPENTEAEAVLPEEGAEGDAGSPEEFVQDQGDTAGQEAADTGNTDLENADSDSGSPDDSVDPELSGDGGYTDEAAAPAFPEDPEGEAPEEKTYTTVYEATIRVKTGRMTAGGESGADAAAALLPEEADVTVRAEAEPGTFPEGTEMVISTVEGDALDVVAESVADAVSTEQGNRSGGFQAVDITFRNADGKEIEPARPIRVTMTSEAIRTAAEDNSIDALHIVHVDDRGKGEEVPQIATGDLAAAEAFGEGAGADLSAAETSDNSRSSDVLTGSDGQQSSDGQTGTDEQTGSDEQTERDAQTGSDEQPYSDGQTGNDGQTGSVGQTGSDELTGTDRFSEAQDPAGNPAGQPAAGENRDALSEDTESFDSAEMAGAAENAVTFEADRFSIYAIVYTVDFEYAVNGKMFRFSLPGGGFVSFTDLVEVLGITDDTKSLKNEDKNRVETAENAAGEGLEKSGVNSDTDTALTLGDVEVSETTRKFVADVAGVEFSSPELVDVSRVEGETTVGQIKKSRGLECEYSAELTKDQISEINAQMVEPGDWALISMLPFKSEETLTVTMKNGEVFTVRVTDYQISAKVLTADGKTYKITVTYDDSAQIPEGTELAAREIEQGTDEYLQHLGKAWAEVNKEYLEQKEERQKNKGGLDEYEDIRPVNLDDARFFSISLINNRKEIEPKAPVHVDIEYVDGFTAAAEEEDQVIGVAHYKKEETELITDVRTERNEAGEIVGFVYEQDSFSDIGTYVGQKTYDNAPYEMDQTLAMPLLRALSNSTRNGNQLKDIEAHKSLTNNDDGTYTMSLTVKGDAVAYEEYNKANILFVMDRSSSMNDNKVYQEYKDSTYNSNTTYYRKNGDNYEALFLNNGQVCTRRQGGYGWVYTPYTGTIYTSVTRLVAEQAAMDVLIKNLLEKNDPDTSGKEDLIEISVISFAEDRQSGNTEYTGWTNNDYTGLMSAVNQTNTPKGTNWEDALIYAREQAALKKTAQPDEDVYVIFLTDGEPTAVYGERNGALHYISNGVTTRGGFEFALTEDSSLYSGSAGEADGKNALDRAKEIVDAGYKFYGIFTFNPGEAQTRYLRRLMNFAYTGVDKAYENDSTKEDTDIVKKYFTNADTPETLTAAFEKIFADVSNMLGHGDVVITDGLQAADAMTTTIHANRADGFRYSVTDDATGNELYYVTATGNDTAPTVTFHINDHEYPAGAARQGVDGKPYYSVTVNGTEYKMALADLTGRELKWDLSAIGTLLPGCTYKVDIIVWPNQEAYDYVAGLNNRLPGYTWDSSVESDPDYYHEVTVNDVTYGYYTGGVSGHSSIVKYKDSGVFSVLTNTHQELNYSIVNTKTNEVTGETTMTSDPQTPVKLEPQKPMDLVDTSSEIEKQWNVDLDPAILAQLLYPADGGHYTLTFDILQDTNKTAYKTLTLGWDSAQNKYVWESGSERDIKYNGRTYSIGTTWKKDFAVPTGLMLSEERMDELGMDKSAYPSGTWPVDPDNPDSELKTYYILEDGHDYTIKERNLSYEFDFYADVFHPMLVDGKMQNVNFTKNGMTINISNMTNTAGGLSSLKVENSLRGYIHLEKHVVDESGSAVAADKTKFEYTIVLTNENAPFVGTHIPWYGINGLYYHDADFNYYQVYYENSALKIRNESGAVYPVKGSYDVDDADEQNITYTDGDEDKTLTLRGNQTTTSNENKTATATLQISQGEVLSIANVPAGTGYTITESAEPGYSLVKIEKRIDPDDVEEDPAETTVNPENQSITGTIVPNHHNYIDYTNRCLVTDITIQKTDHKGKGLEGAVFRLKTVSDNGHSEADAAAIDTISGIGDVVKNVDGKTKTFPSSFETTGEIQTISGLPDGTYRLYEVHVPDGYICTCQYIQFEVEHRIIKNVTTDTGDTGKLDTTANNIDLRITNEPGAALPDTGGPGTLIFTIPGSFLLLGAGLLLLRRQRLAR